MADPINPYVAWPGDDMNPDNIETAAGQIRTVGSNVSTTGGDVATAWSGLSKGYHAPEQQTLFGAMKPAHQAATDFGTDMDKVATALETFAGEVRTIKANIAKIRADAYTFREGIHDGKVTVKHTAVTGGYAGYERGQTKTTYEDVDWQSDNPSVAENNQLVHRLHDQEEQLTRAERTCANAIRDLYGAPHIFPRSESNPNGYGLTDIPDNAPEPWGTAVDVKEDCGDKVADGVMIDGVMNGLGGFIGFHYTPLSAEGPEKLGFSWSTAGQHWMGLGQTAQGLVNPLTPALAFLPGPAGRWFNSSYEAATGFVPGMLGIDVFKHDPNRHWITDWNTDPLHNWKDNPARTAGSVGFNALTLAIPGPKGLGALTKGGRAARAAEEAGEAGNASRAADGLGDLAKVSGDGADLSKVAGDVTKSELSDLGKNAGDLGDGLKGLDKTDIDVPNAPHDNVNIDHPNTGDHAPGEAPPARDGDQQPGHGAGSTGHESAGTGHTASGSGPAASSAPHLSKGLEHQSFEDTSHGYGPGTHHLDNTHPPMKVGTNSNKIGQVGESLTRQDLLDRGYRIISEQARIRLPGTTTKYFKPDFIAVDPHGNLTLIESKMGEGAKFTPNQLVGYDHYAQGHPLAGSSPKVRGDLATLLRQHGLSPRSPVSKVEVYRWNTEIVPDAGLRARAGVP